MLKKWFWFKLFGRDLGDGSVKLSCLSSEGAFLAYAHQAAIDRALVEPIDRFYRIDMRNVADYNLASISRGLGPQSKFSYGLEWLFGFSGAWTLILNFHHRGLRRLYEKDESRGINPEHVEKLRNILARLEVAQAPGEMDLPGFRLHSLSGDRSGTWAVTVRTNWRVTFRFDGEDVADVKYEDYH